MATAYANGCTSVHTLTGGYSNSTVNDIRHMRAFLEGVDCDDLPEDVAPPVPNNAKPIEDENPFGDDNFDFMDASMFGDIGGAPAREGRRAQKGRRARD